MSMSIPHNYRDLFRPENQASGLASPEVPEPYSRRAYITMVSVSILKIAAEATPAQLSPVTELFPTHPAVTQAVAQIATVAAAPAPAVEKPSLEDPRMWTTPELDDINANLSAIRERAQRLAGHAVVDMNADLSTAIGAPQATVAQEHMSHPDFSTYLADTGVQLTNTDGKTEYRDNVVHGNFGGTPDQNAIGFNGDSVRPETTAGFNPNDTSYEDGMAA